MAATLVESRPRHRPRKLVVLAVGVMMLGFSCRDGFHDAELSTLGDCPRSKKNKKVRTGYEADIGYGRLKPAQTD
jgi:hypothetical protein